MPSELPFGIPLGTIWYVLPGMLFVAQNMILCRGGSISMTRTTRTFGIETSRRDLGSAFYGVDYKLTPNTQVTLAPLGWSRAPDAEALPVEPLEIEGQPYALQILTTRSKLALVRLPIEGYVKGELLTDNGYLKLKATVDQTVSSFSDDRTRVY
jgi:hypothetical protein